MLRQKRLATALMLSLTIYLVPVVTPHWIDLFGLSLVRELSGEREMAWKAADVALALMMQAALFAAAWWALSRRVAPAVSVTLLLLIPATSALNVAYLSAIPSRFLIEVDATPDSSTWREVCTAEGYSLDPVREGISRGLERRGEALVRDDAGARYAILQTPGCTLEPVAIPELAVAPGLQQALPDGSVVYTTMERGSGLQHFWFLKRGATQATALQPPQGDGDRVPIVAEGGDWVAWLLRSADREASLRIEPLGEGEPLLFSHALLQRATLVPVELDMASHTVTVNRDLSAFAMIGLDGNVAWGPLTPGPIAAQTDTFRYVDGQWAAWDAYVENTRYRVGWSTREGQGRYEAPKGRLITSAAIDRRGRFVAVSTTTGLNIGTIRDTVVVFRTRDGGEVLRKTLPTYARSQVAFLGDDYFAYSDVDGVHSRTRLLQMTE